MNYKVLIIEDEPLVAKDLQKLVKQLDPGIQVLAVIDSVEHALEWFAANPQPDLIFADVQLSDGVSFDIFRETATDVPLIFTTAYDDYAIHAFKVNGIDYLLKPVHEEDLKLAWKKFLKLHAQKPSSLNLQELMLSFAQGTKRYKERFAVHSGQQMLTLQVSDVCLFKREELIFLVDREGKQFMCDFHSLEELEDLLDPARFFRANRQVIVHIDSIQGYKASYNGKIDLKLKTKVNEEIMVSREKASQFKEWLG
jgi:two-component system LytT family response regulator